MTYPRSIPRLAPSLAALVLAAFVAACGGSDDDNGGGNGGGPVLAVDASGTSTVDASALTSTLSTYPLEALSPAEAASLAFMREEEQLAHDVYAASAAIWPTPVFGNIATSEATHSAAVAALLVRYQQPDPLAGLAQGTFASASFQSLYAQLVAASAASLVDAAKVGAQIEELDIRDLGQQKVAVDNADILFVYDNLLKGSRNHLRAYVNVLTAQGATYTPQYITQAEFDAIVGSTMETGR